MFYISITSHSYAQIKQNNEANKYYIFDDDALQHDGLFTRKSDIERPH